MGRTMRNDPSRTGLIIHAFLSQIHRRSRILQSDVEALIVGEDAFGLTLPTLPHIQNVEQQFRFMSNPDKAKAFFEWLQKQLDAGLLEIESSGGGWTNTYITSAYKKGVLRAYADTHPEVASPSAAFYAGGRHAFIVSAFGGAETVQRLALLYMRSIEQLKGMTASMSQKLAAILAQGLADGTPPKKLAKLINTQIEGISRKRGYLIAHTEIIHAHAEGQLDAFEELGIDELGLYAEWSTAGDDRVCPLCNDNEGVMFTVAEARGLIPLHPLCRCCWIPSAIPSEPKENKLETNARYERVLINHGFRGRVSRFAVRDRTRYNQGRFHE